MNGANCEHSRENIQPTVTSYDYNSPISESGDRTPLYYAIRQLFIDKGIAVPELTAIDSEKRAYGKVNFTKQADLFENLTAINTPVHSSYPLYMEELGQSYGYINYSTIVQNCHDPEAFIEIEELADRAILFVDGKKLGIIGKIHPNVTKDNVYVMELNLEELSNANHENMKYKEISKFPNVSKDVAFVVSKDAKSSDIEAIIRKAAGKKLINLEVFDVYEGVNVGEGKKSIAYSLTFNDKEKTLSDEEVLAVFNKVIEKVTSEYEATVRDS
jgi:ferredoxin-fold anticodon binding domain-containing protein